MTLALDRIQSVQLIDEMKFYDDENFNPDAYYKNVIGVTVNDGLLARNIILKLDRKNAPYVLTKPLHSSPEVIHNDKDGITITLSWCPTTRWKDFYWALAPALRYSLLPP